MALSVAFCPTQVSWWIGRASRQDTSAFRSCGVWISY